MKNIKFKKLILLVCVTVVVLGSAGTGIYFLAKPDEKSEIKQNINVGEIIQDQISNSKKESTIPYVENTGLVDSPVTDNDLAPDTSQYLPNYNSSWLDDSKKEIPSRRNGHFVDCNFYETETEETPYKIVTKGYSRYIKEAYDEQTIIPNTIVCLMLDSNNKVSNFFPVFVFDDITFELARLKDGDFEAGSLPPFKITEAATKRSYKYAQNNARTVTNYLLNSISYGSELALLDKVFLKNEIVKEVNAKGVYTQSNTSNQHKPFLVKNDDSEVTLTGNERTIGLQIPSTQDLFISQFRNSNLVSDFYRNKATQGITFDLYGVGHTFAHEYGHHVTLFTNKHDELKNDFLEKLQETFPTKDNSKREDFVFLYKYFNKLDESNTDDYINLEADKREDAKLTDRDLRAIGIFRKYFSKGVFSLKDVFKDEYSEDSSWKETKFKEISDIYNNSVISKLISWLKDETSTLKKLIEEDKELTKENYTNFKNNLNDGTFDNLFFYKVNLNKYLINKNYEYTYTDRETNKEVSKKIEESDVAYFLLPSSFNETNDKTYNTDDVSTTVGSIIKEASVFLNDEKQKEEDFSCNDTPFNFPTSGGLNYEGILVNQLLPQYQITPNKTKDDLFTAVQKELLNNLIYYFSYKELTARLYGITGFIYSDKRVSMRGCQLVTIDGSNDDSIKLALYSSPSLESDAFSDYGLFKAFDMNILEEGKPEELLNFLNNIKRTNTENSISFKTGKDRNGDLTKFIYSNNYFGTNVSSSNEDIPSNENQEIENWSSVYLMAHMNLENSSDLSKVTIEFTNDKGKEYRKAYNFDYNNRKVVNASSSSTFDENLDYVDLDENIKENVEVVFLIDTIQGYVRNTTSELESPIVLSNTEIQSEEELKSTYSNITKVFIDENNNGIFDQGETTITINK